MKFVYHELYPNALREVADGVQGYLYEVCVEESKVLPFKTKEQLNWWYASIENDLKEKDMINKPDCSYAGFIKEKFPQVWEKYIGNSE